MLPAATPVELSDYDPNRNDQLKIDAGVWVPCRICQNAFRRIRLTWRYCATCHRAFCDGEHGNFAPRSHVGRCTSCGNIALRQVPAASSN
jgi:hypothetical protein